MELREEERQHGEQTLAKSQNNVAHLGGKGGGGLLLIQKGPEPISSTKAAWAIGQLRLLMPRSEARPHEERKGFHCSLIFEYH